MLPAELLLAILTSVSSLFSAVLALLLFAAAAPTTELSSGVEPLSPKALAAPEPNAFSAQLLTSP